MVRELPEVNMEKGSGLGTAACVQAAGKIRFAAFAGTQQQLGWVGGTQ